MRSPAYLCVFSQPASYDSVQLRLTCIYDILIKFRHGIDTMYVTRPLLPCNLKLVGIMVPAAWRCHVGKIYLTLNMLLFQNIY